VGRKLLDVFCAGEQNRPVLLRIVGEAAVDVVLDLHKEEEIEVVRHYTQEDRGSGTMKHKRSYLLVKYRESEIRSDGGLTGVLLLVVVEQQLVSSRSLASEDRSPDSAYRGERFRRSIAVVEL